MDIVIHHVELSLVGKDQKNPVYVATVEEPGFVDDSGEGLLGCVLHIVPADTFETRAAEYDIDVNKPGGWDQVFELVFGDTSGGLSPEEQLNDPDFLLNSPTVAQAREAQLGKIRKARGEGKVRGLTGQSEQKGILNEARAINNSAEEDPLEFIKRTAPMSKEHMAVKREFTRRRRNLVRARRAGRHPFEAADLDAVDGQVKRDMKLMPDRETPEQLAQTLLGSIPDTSGDVAEGTGMPPRVGEPSKYL